MRNKEVLNQELIKTRKGNKDDKRQQIRKNIEQSSRLLDGYYNPKIHNQIWKAGGTVKEKPQYPSDSSYNSSTQSSQKQKDQTHFLEFDYIENNDVIITIEHCTNCEEHQSHTQHINNIFKNIAKLLQKSILIRFPFIKVYLKPISPDSISSRIGAFEVQICKKIDNKITIDTIFSKLNTGLWPNIHNVLNKISTVVPSLNIKCVLFDKEEGLDNNNANNTSDFLPTRYEHIKVNLCLLNIQQIAEFSAQVTDALDLIFNPKRRQIVLKEQSEINETGQQKLSITRPTTSRANAQNLSNASFLSCNSASSRVIENNMKYSYSSSNTSKMEMIDNVDMLKGMKGKLLSSGKTNREGILIFHNVPYDSYIIEVEASRNFLSCGLLIKYNKIISNTSQQGELYTQNKIFGLRRQIDAYVEVFIYSNKRGDELDMELITDAKVTLIRKYGEEMGNYAFLEDRFELKENMNEKGIYEIITTPGKMKLNVIKGGFEEINRDVQLKSGENKINIQLI